MLMQMLHAGGLPPVEGSMPGSYELAYGRYCDSVPAGRAVKLLNLFLDCGIPRAPAWRFVWLDRDPWQQATSQIKFLNIMAPVTGLPHVGAGEVEMWAHSYLRERPRALAKLRRHGLVMVLRYERVLANPRRAAQQLRRVWPGLDVDAAAAVVHRRDGTCRPDMAVELAATQGVG
jgi:hypothetical protein